MDADVPVLDIEGFDDYVIPHPMNLKAVALDRTGSGTPNIGSEGGLYIGNDFRVGVCSGGFPDRFGAIGRAV